MSRHTVAVTTPLEALVVEQALLLARQLQQTADGSPDGQVLARVEAFAVPAARELARRAVEAALQQQAARAEKKGCPAGAVPAATGSAGTRGGRRGPS